MQYQFTGKIIKVGSVIPVTGKVREKCTFIVRDEDDGAREIAFILFDSNIDAFLTPLELGDKVRVTFTIKSREYQGSYTTNCFAINVEKIEDRKQQQQQQSGRNRYQKQEQRDDYGQGPFGGFGGSESFNDYFKRKAREEANQERQRQQQQNNQRSGGSTNFTDWFKGCRTADEAKKRYRELCKEHHPDKPGGSTEKMQEINKQYDRWR